MFEQIDPARKPLTLKRPLIALAISVGAVVVGSAVCTPGICGCTSWTGLSIFGALGEAGLLFLLLSVVGMVGVAISLCWMLVLFVKGTIMRRSERQRG